MEQASAPYIPLQAVGVLARGADSNGAAPMDVDQRQNGTSKAKFGPKKSSRGDLYVGSAALSYRRDHMEVSWGFTSLQKSTALHSLARRRPASQCCTL